jgi:hypothetical protein
MLKLICLTGGFLVFFSITSNGQDSTIKSVHPKMDKYYPRPQKTQILDNNAESYTPAKPVTPTSPAPVMTSTPPPANTVVNPAPAVKPTIPAPAEPQVETGPAITSTPVTVEPTNTAVNSPDSVSAPATVTVTAPPPKPISKPATPAPPPYMDTRLGSSAPQYDTWEKNNNGAGSVTTQSKQ